MTPWERTWPGTTVDHRQPAADNNGTCIRDRLQSAEDGDRDAGRAAAIAVAT
jgi:hypothetical protein